MKNASLSIHHHPKETALVTYSRPLSAGDGPYLEIVPMIAFQEHKVDNGVQSPHDDFLMLMPVVQRCAQLFFRSWPVVHREEAIAEAVAAALVSFISLKRRGKNPFQFPSVIAMRAVQHVQNDRHVGGRSNGRDVLSRRAKLRYGYDVEGISTVGPWQEALIDNTQTPIPDQVCFRCDVPAWLHTLKRRDRKIAILLSQGYSTSEVARQFGLTSGRISQLRRELYASWQNFHGEPVMAAA